MLRRPCAAGAAEFRASFYDLYAGLVSISGLFFDVPESDRLVVIIHGLGGSAASPYGLKAARAAQRAGVTSLCLSMRGADGSGADIFHGGLTEDLWVALSSPELRRFRKVSLLGFSVGGHIAIKGALDGVDPRLCSVAAICPPLDLDAATIAFDHPSRRLYRRHIFDCLNRNYTATAARMEGLVPPEVVKRSASCRERDALTVVPRFGFANVKDYSESESVIRRIHRLEVPTLLVAAKHDPIIPFETVLPGLGRASKALTIRAVENGGHVYFPKSLDLENETIQWLMRH